QFPFQFTLNYLHRHGSRFPEHLHDLQLQGRHLFTLAAWHSGSSPKTLGGQYSRHASVSTKTLVELDSAERTERVALRSRPAWNVILATRPAAQDRIPRRAATEGRPYSYAQYAPEG